MLPPTFCSFLNRLYSGIAHTIYALGASLELTRNVYYKTPPQRLPSLVSPGGIIKENFIEPWGDEKYESIMSLG